MYDNCVDGQSDIEIADALGLSVITVPREMSFPNQPNQIDSFLKYVSSEFQCSSSVKDDAGMHLTYDTPFGPVEQFIRAKSDGDCEYTPQKQTPGLLVVIDPKKKNTSLFYKAAAS